MRYQIGRIELHADEISEMHVELAHGRIHYTDLYTTSKKVGENPGDKNLLCKERAKRALNE